MVSPGQKWGGYGNLMAAFDTHTFFARSHDKGKATNPSVAKQNCTFCNILTSDQRSQLATPSYKKLKKEKQDLKENLTNPTLQK